MVPHMLGGLGLLERQCMGHSFPLPFLLLDHQSRSSPRHPSPLRCPTAEHPRLAFRPLPPQLSLQEAFSPDPASAQLIMSAACAGLMADLHHIARLSRLEVLSLPLTQPDSASAMVPHLQVGWPGRASHRKVAAGHWPP